LNDCAEIREEGLRDSDENAIIGMSNQGATLEPIHRSRPTPRGPGPPEAGKSSARTRSVGVALTIMAPGGSSPECPQFRTEISLPIRAEVAPAVFRPWGLPIPIGIG
jgi:hypothetical protein